MKEIRKNIFVETDYLAPNVGCIVSEKGAVLIESPFLPKDARHWKHILEDNGVRNSAYIINTHCHFDHMLGNCFLDGKVIGHKTARKGFEFYTDVNNLRRDIGMFFPQYLEDWQGNFGDVEIVFPEIEISQEVTLCLGDTEIHIESVGGHSIDSLLVYIPSEKVVFAGDLLENSRHPGMTNANFDALLKVLRRIEQMNVDTVVPGHGPVGDLNVVVRQRQYFEEMISLTKSLKEAGKSVEAVAQKVAEHMLSYLPPIKGEEEINRNMVAVGARRMFKQV